MVRQSRWILSKVPSLIEGNAHQVVNQLIGVGIVAAYDAIVSLLILKIIDRSLGLRVSRWPVSSPSRRRLVSSARPGRWRSA